MKKRLAMMVAACTTAILCFSPSAFATEYNYNEGPFDEWGCPWTYTYDTGDGDTGCILGEGGTPTSDPDYEYTFVEPFEYFAGEKAAFDNAIANVKSNNGGFLYHKDIWIARNMAYIFACAQNGYGLPECQNRKNETALGTLGVGDFPSEQLYREFSDNAASTICSDEVEPWNCGYLPVPLWEEEEEPNPNPEPQPNPNPNPPGDDEEYEEIDPDGEEYADCIDTAPDVKQTYEMKIDWNRGEFVCELDLREATQCRTKNAEKVVYRPHGSYINGVYHYTINSYCKYPGGKGKANKQSSNGKQSKAVKAKTCKQKAKAKGFKRASKQTAFIKKCNAKKVQKAKAKSKAKAKAHSKGKAKAKGKQQSVKGIQMAGGLETPGRLAVPWCVPGRETFFSPRTVASFQSLSEANQRQLCLYISDWVKTDPFFAICTQEPWRLVITDLTTRMHFQWYGGCESDYYKDPVVKEEPYTNLDTWGGAAKRKWSGWDADFLWYDTKWKSCTKAHSKRYCANRRAPRLSRANACDAKVQKVRTGGKKAYAKSLRKCAANNGFRVRALKIY